MPRFCANLTFLFKEMPFLERFQAAAEAGFEAVEILFPYDVAAPDIVRRLNATGLPLVLINAPPPNYTGGARGFAAVPAAAARFKSDFRRVLRYAERLAPQHIHIMSGQASGSEARATLIDNLKWAADHAPNRSLTIEPLSPGTFEGYFLDSFDLAVEVIEAVGAYNLGLQFDSFHAQMLTGDAVSAWHAYRPHVRHVQVGDAPKRNAPGGGTVDFEKLFAAISASGYDGWISAEYNPDGRTQESLGWMRQGAMT